MMLKVADERAAEATVPEWFDRRLLPDLVRKVNRPRGIVSLVDTVVLHGLSFLFGTKRWRYVKQYDWSELEHFIGDDCREIIASGFRPEVIIGIRSGGAFLANCVARQLGVSTVGYIGVDRYSPLLGSTCLAFVWKFFRAPKLTCDLQTDVAARKVLLIDDQTATGKTLRLASGRLESSGACEIRTYCVFTQGFRPDFGRRSGIMLNAPWGDDP